MFKSVLFTSSLIYSVIPVLGYQLKFPGVVLDMKSLGASPSNDIFAPAVYYETSKNPGQVISDDFNNDGNLDLALTNMGSGQVSIFLGNGQGVFKPSYSYVIGYTTEGLARCDFNNDGNLDIAAALENGNGIALLMGYGNGTFYSGPKYTLDGVHFGIITNDFDKDGNCDFATVDRVDGGNVAVVLGNGNGVFRSAQIYSGYSLPSWLDSADLNKDGADDIVFTNYGSASISVLLGKGNGTFQQGSNFAIQSSPSFLTIKDFNNDGNYDVAASNADSHSVSVLLGKGDGTFQDAVNYPIDGEWTSMVDAADFNLDGKLDLVANAQYSDFVTVLLGNGDGTFQATSTKYQSIGQPCIFSIGDFNKDSKPDLAIPNYSANNISILLNTVPDTCILLTEASSSKTAFYSYTVQWQGNNPVLNKNIIDGNPNTKDKIDQYAQGIMGKTAEGYYLVMTNKDITDHIMTSKCTEFSWGLLATGGMRDNVDVDVANSFYTEIKYLFNTRDQFSPKKVNLVKAVTIAGEDEGRYAWLTLKYQHDITDHAMIDIGGQTMQFANGSTIHDAWSWSLGNKATRAEVGFLPDGNLGEIFCNNYDGSTQGNTVFKYNGVECRNQIAGVLENYDDIPTLKRSSYGEFFNIGTFYNYFYPICGTYLPEIQSGKLSVNPGTAEQIYKSCNASSSIPMTINWYQNITDEVCKYWNTNWNINNQQILFADSICFSGNYAYQLLKRFGLEDNDQVHVKLVSDDDVTIESATWSLGAAYDIFNSVE